jgi:hypothetical protein
MPAPAVRAHPREPQSQKGDQSVAECPPYSGKMEDFPFQSPAPYFAEEVKGWKGYIEASLDTSSAPPSHAAI